MAIKRRIAPSAKVAVRCGVLFGALMVHAFAAFGADSKANSGLEVETIVAYRSGVEDVLLSFGPGLKAGLPNILISFDGEATSFSPVASGVFDAAALLTSPWVDDGSAGSSVGGNVGLLGASAGVLMLLAAIAGLAAMLRKPTLLGFLLSVGLAVVCTLIPPVLAVLGGTMCDTIPRVKTNGLFSERCTGASSPVDRSEMTGSKEYVLSAMESTAGSVDVASSAALQDQVERLSNHFMFKLNERHAEHCRIFLRFSIKTPKFTLPRVWTRDFTNTHERLYLVSETGLREGQDGVIFQAQLSKSHGFEDLIPVSFRTRSGFSVAFPALAEILWDGCVLTRVEGRKDLDAASLERQGGDLWEFRDSVFSTKCLLDICSYGLLLVLSWLPVALSLLWTVGLWELRLPVYAGVIGITGFLVGLFATQAHVVPESELLREDHSAPRMREPIERAVQAEEGLLRGKNREEMAANLNTVLEGMTNVQTGLPLRNEASFGNYEVVNTLDGVCVQYYDGSDCSMQVGYPDSICIETTAPGLP